MFQIHIPGLLVAGKRGLPHISSHKSLPSYSGFFAREELFEVKPADEDHNPLHHAYFVTAAELEAYSEAERVFETIDSHQSLLRHAKGKFLSRLAGRARKKSASYYTPESLTRCLIKYALKERIGENPGDLNWLTADEILQLTVCEMSVGSAAFLNEAINQLAAAYLQRKQKETGIIIPHDEYIQELQKVKMFIADNNVFGVDLNPTAVELAEISLWLNTIYEGAFVPWFGLQLACANSLIGARRETYLTDFLLARAGKGGSKARWPEVPPTPDRWETQDCKTQDTRTEADSAQSFSNGALALADPSSAPTGQNTTAQGNALGSDPEPISSPERATQTPASPTTLPPRPSDSVYHWLLGDPGMASYDDKVIKSLAKSHLDRIKLWKSNFVPPLRKRRPSRTPLTIRRRRHPPRQAPRHHPKTPRRNHGSTHPLGPRLFFFLHSCVLQSWVLRLLLHPREGQEVGHRTPPPLQPLFPQKISLDYWCALWFWPIEQSALLPTRQQFLTEISLLLGHTLGFAPPAAAQGEFDALLVDLPGHTVEIQQTDLKLDDTVVNVDKLCAQSPRLALVRTLANERKFFHWELEFIDLFARRGGFDLILGNPPWVRVEWNEGDLLSEKNPAFTIRDLSASQVAAAREEQLEIPAQRVAYFSEFVEFAGAHAFLNAPQNYNILTGQKANLYQCFLSRAWDITNSQGITGFLHPEGVYDDSNGGPLRRELYPRLRKQFQFQNELSLFEEIHHIAKYSINIYSLPHEVSFTSLANLFAVLTVDRSFLHDGQDLAGAIKNDENRWSLEGHRDRLVEITQKELILFARLYDGKGTPTLEARIPALHTEKIMSVLDKFSDYPNKLSGLSDQTFTTQHWNEVNAQKEHTIRRDRQFPSNTSQLVLSGSHLNVGNPLSKSPRYPCVLRSDYDSLDLSILPDDYLPRTNYLHFQ